MILWLDRWLQPADGCLSVVNGALRMLLSPNPGFNFAYAHSLQLSQTEEEESDLPAVTPHRRLCSKTAVFWPASWAARVWRQRINVSSVGMEAWQGWECSLSWLPVIKKKAGSLWTLHLIMTEGYGSYQSGLFWVSYCTWIASVSSVQWEDGSMLFPVSSTLQLETGLTQISQLALFAQPSTSKPWKQGKCVWWGSALLLRRMKHPRRSCFPLNVLQLFSPSLCVMTWKSWKTLFYWLVSRGVNGKKYWTHDLLIIV